MSSSTNVFFLLLYIWKMVSLGVYRWTHALREGNFHVWPTPRYVPLCMVQIYGIFKKKVFNCTIQRLKQGCNFTHFALNRDRIEGLQQHSPNQTSFKFLPPGGGGGKFPPLHMTITRQTNRLGKTKYELAKEYTEHLPLN